MSMSDFTGGAGGLSARPDKSRSAAYARAVPAIVIAVALAVWFIVEGSVAVGLICLGVAVLILLMLWPVLVMFRRQDRES